MGERRRTFRGAGGPPNWQVRSPRYLGEFLLVLLKGEEDAEGEFELVHFHAGEEGVEDALLDQEGHGFGDVFAVVFGLAVEDVGELVHELGIAGEPGLLLVETAEGGGVGLECESAFFAWLGDEFADAVVFVVLAEVEDEALVRGGESREFADLFHSFLGRSAAPR